MKLKSIKINPNALTELDDHAALELDLLCRNVLDQGKNLAPVDTGALKDSLKYSGIDRSKMSGYIISDGKTPKGKDVYYWQYVHFGHMAKRTWVPPNKFIIDAAKNAFNGEIK